MEAPPVGVWVADETARTLEARAFSDDELGATYPRRRIGFDEGLPGWVATHRQPVIVPDVFDDGRVLARRLVPAARLRSAYIVPSCTRAALLGVLAMNGPAPFELDAEDRELLESFVGHAALAIRNARLYEDARGARDFLRSIAEHSPAGIVTTDVRGHVTYLSPRAEELLGYRPDEVLGRPVAELPARRAGRGPGPDATPPRGRAHPGARDRDPGAGRALGRVPLLARSAPRRGRHGDRHARHPGGHLGAQAPRGPAPAGAEDGGRRPPGRRDRPRLQQPPRRHHGPQRPHQERAPEGRRAGPRRGADPARVRARGRR